MINKPRTCETRRLTKETKLSITRFKVVMGNVLMIHWNALPVSLGLGPAVVPQHP